MAVDARDAGTAPGPRRFTLDDVRSTYKRRDAWWTVFLVDPLAARLILPLANRTNVTPNQVSFASFGVGLLAAVAFLQAHHAALVVGALLYHLSFVLDCIDGKIARLKGTGSVFGMWLDYSFDRYRVLVCTAALMYGQYQRTGEVVFIWLAVLVTFLDMLRYMDALQVYKLRREMTSRLRRAGRAGSAAALGGSYLVPAQQQVRYLPGGGARDSGFHRVPPSTSGEPHMYDVGNRTAQDLQQEFRSRFGWWAGIRDLLMRKRVRPHLFSGIEFQMFVFIVGPLLDAVLPVVLLSAVLLLVFEAAIIYKLLLSSRDFERQMRRLSGPEDESVAVTATATAAGAMETDDLPRSTAAAEGPLEADDLPRGATPATPTRVSDRRTPSGDERR